MTNLRVLAISVLGVGSSILAALVTAPTLLVATSGCPGEPLGNTTGSTTGSYCPPGQNCDCPSGENCGGTTGDGTTTTTGGTTGGDPACTCTLALSGLCNNPPSNVAAAVQAVKTCGEANAQKPSCAQCAAGDVYKCSSCYAECGPSLDGCLTLEGACTPKYATCKAAQTAGVAYSSDELCGSERILARSLGICACKAGCAASCPNFCVGKQGDDVTACSKCYYDKYATSCAAEYGSCMGTLDGGAGDGGRDGGGDGGDGG